MKIKQMMKIKKKKKIRQKKIKQIIFLIQMIKIQKIITQNLDQIYLIFIMLN